MGMFDTFNLIEPLPCYECNSTADDKVGSFEDKRKINIAGKKLTWIRLHDGKGGIKNFQTKDLECIMADYYFPGFVPNSGIQDAYSSLSLVKICNCCNTLWDGQLFLKYEKSDDICITTQLDMWIDNESDHSDLKWKVASTEFYELSVADDGRISLFPKIDKAIRYYLKQKDFFESKIDVYRSFLSSMGGKDVPKEKITQFLDKLVKNKVSSKKRGYVNKLAQSLDLYQLTESTMIYTKSALNAALVILHHYDQEAALDIIAMPGLSSEEFIKDLEMHDWFFKPDKDSDGLKRLWGIMGGTNYFLDKLKKN